MTTGRLWDSADPAYKVPVMKIVIGDDAPDNSVIPAALRSAPDLVPGALQAINDNRVPTFELQRGTAAVNPEFEWAHQRQALRPSEDTVISRRFRTFIGSYVGRCHNPTHEDHSMMFARRIVP